MPPRRAVIRWPTGSGKTLAFSLPMIARLDMPACGTGLQALVVTPTRELALQTLQVLKKLTDHGKTNKKGYTVKVMALLGRSTPRVESELLRSPPDIAIGTPFAISKLLQAKKLKLSRQAGAASKRTIVLDEIGALTTDAHWPSVKKLLYDFDITQPKSTAFKDAPPPSKLPRGRWVDGAMWFVSAHVPPGAVERCLAASYGLLLNEEDDKAPTPKLPSNAPPVALLEPSHSHKLPATIKHVCIPLYNMPQPKPTLGVLLATMLQHGYGAKRYELPVGGDEEGMEAMEGMEEYGGGDEVVGMEEEAAVGGGGLESSAKSILVFTDSSDQAELLKKTLRNRRIKASAVHSRDGDTAENPRLSGHAKRGYALKEFAARRLRVLVATDMLAFGVDIRGATHVVNAAVPRELQTYLHRAGRVGRKGGSPGTVVTLPRTEEEMERLRQFEKALGFEMVMGEWDPGSVPLHPNAVRRARREAAQMGQVEEPFGNQQSSREQAWLRGG